MRKAKHSRGKAAAAGLILTAALAGSFQFSSILSLAAPGTAAYNANIRAEASSDSEGIASVSVGDSLELGETTTGADGNTWYAVTTSSGATGYIRSDLVTLSSTDSSDTASSETVDSGSSSSDTGVAQASGDGYAVAMTPTSATISGDCNIRSGAGTNYNRIGTLSSGTSLVVIGQAADSSGQIWYQFYTTGLEQQMTGFVISDYITLGEAVQTTGGESAETQESETQESSTPADYEAVYTADENGQDTWYLYNNAEGTREKISDIDAMVVRAQENQAAANQTISTMRTAVIIMAVVIVLLLIGATILILKVRELAYDGPDGFGGSREVDLMETRKRERRRNRNADDISDLETDAETGTSRSARMRQGAYPSRGTGARPERSEARRPERGAQTAPSARPAAARGAAPAPEGNRRPVREPQRPPGAAPRSEGTAAPRRRPAAEGGYEDLPQQRPAARQQRPAAPAQEKRGAQSRNFAYDDDLDYEFLDLDSFSRKD
ncbi:MAG: SH3 domain-containing protein [Eubacteriales bacterium]|nr:SH3 domain-containing protein [Eubacteriales bacterium]